MAKGIPLMGRDPDGKAKMINVDENGNAKVQLSGTLVSETVVDALALTNTNMQYRENGFNLLRDLDEVSIEVVNTLEKSVKLFLRINGWGRIWDPTTNTFVVGPEKPIVTIPPSGRILLSSHPLLRVAIEELKTYSGGNVGFSFRAEEAPTSGSLTIRILGRRRATYA